LSARTVWYSWLERNWFSDRLAAAPHTIQPSLNPTHLPAAGRLSVRLVTMRTGAAH